MKKILNFKIIKLNEVNSTNLYAQMLIDKNQAKNGMVVFAQSQTDGKGQMGNKWFSDKFENLTFSLILIHDNISISNIFYLNKLISIVLVKTLIQLKLKNISIKWPNDILVNNKKIAGVLIENHVQGNLVINSIIGIGINVNQKVFPFKVKREPTSIINEINLNFEPFFILNIFLNTFNLFYCYFLDMDFSFIDKEYKQNLYLFNKFSNFKINSKIVKGIITDVNADGLLVFKNNNEPNQKLYYFDVKEIEF